jgi:hypothetical protein
LLFYFIKNNNVNNLKEENTITTPYETNEPEVVTETKTEKDVNNTPMENKSSAKEQKGDIIKETTIKSNVQNENDNEKASSNSEVIIKNTSKTDKSIEQKKITTQAPKSEIKKDSL